MQVEILKDVSARLEIPGSSLPLLVRHLGVEISGLGWGQPYFYITANYNHPMRYWAVYSVARVHRWSDGTEMFMTSSNEEYTIVSSWAAAYLYEELKDKPIVEEKKE